jgi:hypothetical protein
MDAQQRMVQRLSNLINEGYGVMTVLAQSPESRITPQIEGMYLAWRLGSQSVFATLFNPDNVYREAFGRIAAECPEHDQFLMSEVEKGSGILRAAQAEISYGTLPGIEALYSAEIFEDFLSMAEHLLDQKYFAVVPSLVGAVLEDGLRKITKRKGLTVKVDDSIAGLNGRLFDAKTYSPLVRRKIEVWNSIRNNADHGKFEENTEQDVGQMLEGVRGFLAEHLK